MFLRRRTDHEASDETLVSILCAGDPGALGHLWDRYAHLLFGVGMKYLKDAERSKDMVVELFASLPGLLGKHEVQRFRPWVHTVMRNRCLLALRSDANHRHVGDEALATIAQQPNDEHLIHEQDLQRLERAIDELNEAQRTCIRLFHLERMSYQETAARTGLPIDQVRSNLQNGRRNLRIILHQHAEQNA